MRSARRRDGVSVKAYAGTTGVLLAFDVRPDRRAGLLGFAIEREGGNRPRQWLNGLLHFPGANHPPGRPVPTNAGPVQKFRWSDYRVFPGTAYEYTVHPVYGDPAAPQVRAGPTVKVTTSSVTEGDHRIVFNRAAAASQAFSRAPSSRPTPTAGTSGSNSAVSGVGVPQTGERHISWMRSSLMWICPIAPARAAARALPGIARPSLMTILPRASIPA